MFLAVLVMAVILTTCSVSGTYAKYTSVFNGTSSDTATVAKWAVTVNGKKATENFDFKLFDSIKDTDFAAEDDVAASKIAPGTSGGFNIQLANTSEVTVKYGVTFAHATGSDSTIPLEYCVGTETECKDASATWSATLPTIDITDANNQMAIGANKTIDIQWRWVYAGNDTLDNQLGEAAANADASTPAPMVKLTATVTATQVD